MELKSKTQLVREDTDKIRQEVRRKIEEKLKISGADYGMAAPPRDAALLWQQREREQL